MNVKGKILGAVCATAIVASGFVGISYADEIADTVKEVKGKICNSLCTMDFSTISVLTDAQKEKLTELQAKLKDIMAEEKTVKDEMKTLLKDSGVEFNEGKHERKELTEEQKAEMKEKMGERKELTEEEKAEMKENMPKREGKGRAMKKTAEEDIAAE